MKIDRSTLKKIIAEEIENMLQEEYTPAEQRDFTPAEIALPVAAYYNEIIKIAQGQRVNEQSYQNELTNLKHEIERAKNLADIVKSIKYMIKEFKTNMFVNAAAPYVMKDLKMLFQIAIRKAIK